MGCLRDTAIDILLGRLPAIKRQRTVRAFVAEVYNDQVTIDYDSGQTSAKKLAALIPAHYGVTLISDELIH